MRHGFLASCEVEIDRRFAGQRHAQVRQRAAHRSREQQPDDLLSRRIGRRIHFFKQQRGGQCLAESQLLASGIGDRDGRPMLLRGLNESMDSVLARACGMLAA